MLFVKVTLKSGETFISQFDKLKGIGTYAGQVMTGKKALNRWTVLAHEHPASGERVLVRSRTMVNGSEVASMEEVIPKDGADETAVRRLDVDAFEGSPQIEKGTHGLHKFDEADETRPEGVSTKYGYPIYREPGSLRRFVILDARTEPQRKHFLDAEAAGFSPVPENEDDREHPDDFGYDDDDDNF